MQNDTIHLWFLRLSLILLLSALLFGVLASIGFMGAESLAGFLPFNKLRPLHVSSAFYWIITAAVGGVIFYAKEYFQRFGNKSTDSLPLRIFFILWIIPLAAIFGSYLFGKFGGREYFEYPPVISLFILAGWLCFAYYFVRQVYRHRAVAKPVYVWMWSTGVLFFTLTFIESNLWQIAWFRDNVIRDITVQWKANGAMVGAWNMLIYGTSFYLMGRISGSEEVAFSKKTFFFYFLGFTNLLFNWGHHTYIVPAAPWVRYVAYAISMTEWIIFLNIIRNWRGTLSEARKNLNILPYRFLLASEVWVFINLILALLMSVPAINVYTHGTHITVAHAMGTTIGINTMILMASLFYIAKTGGAAIRIKRINLAFWLTQISLLVFFLSLVIAGIVKGYLSVGLGNQDFHEVMRKVYPYLYIFTVAGFFLLIGMAYMAIAALRVLQQKPD